MSNNTITISSGDNSSEYAVNRIIAIAYRPGEPIYFNYDDPKLGDIGGIKVPVGMIGYEALQALYAERGNAIEAQEKQTTYPADWPDLEFSLGQEVYVHRSDVPRTITGIRLDEPDVPPYSVWQYRAGERWWYEAGDLSAESTASQTAPDTGELFLSGDENLP